MGDLLCQKGGIVNHPYEIVIVTVSYTDEIVRCPYEIAIIGSSTGLSPARKESFSLPMQIYSLFIRIELTGIH